jgi:hypothetical protein
MMRRLIGETREDRQDSMRRAVALVVRRRMAEKRLRQTDVARWSGLSRSFVQQVLRGDSCSSLFALMELTTGLRIEDDLAFLSEIIDQRDELRAALSAQVHAPGDSKPNGV